MQRLAISTVFILICSCVAPGEGTVITTTWCLQEYPIKSISCENKDSTILVMRAWVGVNSQQNPDFCAFPAPLPEDCILGMESNTNSYRQRCNTFNTCALIWDKSPPNTCAGESFNGGKMYLTLEYRCRSIVDSALELFPIVDNCPLLHRTIQSPSVILSSENYPGDNVSISSCLMSVWSQKTRDISIFIRDLSHNVADNMACPYYVKFGDSRQVCARRGLTYTKVDVLHGTWIEIVANTAHPVGRYSMEVTSKVLEDPAILVVVQTESRTTQHPTPTRPKLTTTYTSSPKLPSTTPSPTATSTQRVTFTTSTTVKPRVIPAAVPIDHSTTRRQPSIAASYTASTPGGATVSDSAKGHDESTTSAGGTTLLPRPPSDGMRMGIKLIVGGVITGTFIVIIVIICVGICVGRRKKMAKRQPQDLGYMVHANMTIHNQLSAKAGSLRHLPPILNSIETNKPASRMSQHMRNNSHDNTRSSSENSSHCQPVLRRTDRNAYSNAIERSQNRNHKSRHSNKSVSQATLTANLDDSLEWMTEFAGTPYAVSDAFACFPRWNDNPRSSDATNQYDMLTNTLPAKLNKKPMPLPKPCNSPSDSAISPYEELPTRVVPNLGRSLTLGKLESTERRNETNNKYLMSRTFDAHKPQRSASINGRESGKSTSTDALYAVPNKLRWKKSSNDNVIFKNEVRL